MTPATKPACPRLFEAEALRDGRLTGVEVARFEAHLGVCAICAHESQAMQALADALRAPTNAHDADELHVRRERTRLLAAFDASLMPAPRQTRTKLWFAAAALVALAAAVLVFRARPTAPVSATLDAVKVQAASTTKWSRQTDNQRETVRLESGTLSIRVDHALSPRHLVVLLPDGELEDIGTTFSVSAAAAHTTQVSVQDGTVILRLHGAAALTLRAGDAWSPALSAPVTPAPAPTPEVHNPKPSRSAPPAPAVAAPSAAPAADASADFRAAMSALTSGDNARASTLFGAFLAQHPHDSRTEDASYLRVLALQRSGNTTGMKQAARDYLSRYPHGFRAAEVEPLAELVR